MSRDYLTVNEAAALLGVCRRTIYNWINAGKIAVLRTPSGSPRIERSQLLRPDTQDSK